jgi:hypothetical protein
MTTEVKTEKIAGTISHISPPRFKSEGVNEKRGTRWYLYSMGFQTEEAGEEQTWFNAREFIHTSLDEALGDPYEHCPRRLVALAETFKTGDLVTFTLEREGEREPNVVNVERGDATARQSNGEEKEGKTIASDEPIVTGESTVEILDMRLKEITDMLGGIRAELAEGNKLKRGNMK